MNQVDQRLCSYGEAARRLGISPDTVRRLVALHEIRTVRIGNAVRIPVADLDEIIRCGSASTRHKGD